MPESIKARDLARDPRCALHNSVSDVDGTDGELKLHGSAVEVSDRGLRESDPSVWWASSPPDRARVYSLDLERAAFISYAAGRMTISRWSPQRGLERTERDAI
jgi:hypothetical protein